jgi:hypothetical protein
MARKRLLTLLGGIDAGGGKPPPPPNTASLVQTIAPFTINALAEAIEGAQLIQPIGDIAISSTATNIAPFDPATLPLTGWARGSFVQPDTTTTPSAGTSGANTPFEATAPKSALGAPVDGFAPLTSVATDQNRTFWDLVGGTYNPAGTFLTRTKLSILMLLKPSALAAAPASGFEDSAPSAAGAIRGGTLALGLQLTSSGALAFTNNLGGNQTMAPDQSGGPAYVLGNLANGQWSAVMLTLDTTAGELRIRVGNVESVVPTPFGGCIDFTLSRLNVLYNAIYNKNLPADLMEILTSDQVITNAEMDDYRTSYVPSRYPSMNPV